MHKIALFKVVGDYYGNEEEKIFAITQSFEEVSDEDWLILYRTLSQQYSNLNERYVMVEQTNVNQVKQDLQSIIERLKEEEKRKKLEEQKRKKQAEEQKKKREANALENKRKKLEKLKKELGKV